MENGIRPLRIILAGVAVSAFLGAGISAILVLYSDRIHVLDVDGRGLSARSWPHVDIIWPYALIWIYFSNAGFIAFEYLQLGDDIAKALGLM